MTFAPFSVPGRALGLLTLAAWAASAALAAGASAAAKTEAQQRYRQDMAACNSGQASQSIATCRLEARNALEAARRGALTGSDDYTPNARARCLAHEGTDRSACEARMEGEGTQQGTVKGGGILRKSVTVIPGS